MTTTHTFLGLNTDSRSSSRVLNPPGGLSSNIFGSDNQTKHSCVGSKTEVSREKSENAGPGAAMKTAGPQQKPWAPRSGDDSIHTSFGIYPSSGCDKAPSNIRVNLLVPGAACPKRLNSRSSQNKTADTFRNIFGEGRTVQYRKMFRRVHNASDDSFSRVFGQRGLNEENHPRKGAGPTPSHLSISSIKQGSISPKSDDPDLCTPKSGDARRQPIRPSHSVYTNFGSKSMRLDTQSRVCQAFSSSASLTKNIPLFRRFALNSAFNPITGESYDQAKPKSEPQLNVTPSSEICNNSPVEVQLPAVTAVAPVVENIQREPAEIAQPVPAEIALPVPAEVAQPVAADEPGVEEKPHASQSGRMFGESAEGTKPHSSTRVSQPPGGHSSKLW